MHPPDNNQALYAQRLDRIVPMSLTGFAVEGRANLLARVKLVFDLLLAAALYLRGAPAGLLVIPVLDLIFVAIYLRYVKRSPALLTFLALGLWAGLVALSPLALGSYGLALWVLFPLIPAWAGFVLTRRILLWQMAIITAAIVVVGALLWWQSNASLTFPRNMIAVAATLSLASTLLLAWLMARTSRAEVGSNDLLGEPITVVRGIMVLPLNWVVGGIQSDLLRSELQTLIRQHNPRWIVLDMAPAGDIGRHDLSAIEQAALETNSAQCTVVIARPPVDAIGHLDIAQSQVGRIERFATVAQAMEAGLRRLGWAQQTEQGRRIVTTY